MRRRPGAQALVVTSQQDLLADAFIEIYVRWREEVACTTAAWERWQRVGQNEAMLQSAAYGAAVDREEAAARELRDCVSRILEARVALAPPPTTPC